MRKILNVGIIGCGKHARDFHIPSLLRLKNKFNITGLFDPDFSKTKLRNRKFWVSPQDELLISQVEYYGMQITKGLNYPDIHGTTLLLWALTMIYSIQGSSEFNVIKP